MKSLYYILDEDGRTPIPVSSTEWAKYVNSSQSIRIIARDTVNDMIISTVFLGLDHNHSNEGPPLIFETMIFSGPLDGEQHRCSTYEEALKQHELAKDKARHVYFTNES